MKDIIITIDEVEKILASDADNIILIDMRDEISYRHGYIPGALNVVQAEEAFMPENIKDYNYVVVYCSIGTKSVAAVERLRENGIHAYSLEGGFSSWLVKEDSVLNDDETKIYSRQMILPQIGMTGQHKLKESKVLVVGAGGLGSPVALYLAAAGVGTIGMIDGDNVDYSNLQRQILHDFDKVGEKKVISAKKRLNAMSPYVNVVTYTELLTPYNINEIIKDYDFIIDGVDNFQTKFLINDACVLAKKPFSHAGVLRFEGQLMTYVPGAGACYRCLFEDIPEDDNIPNCSEAGVIGAMAGVIGSFQALEAVKYLTGAGELLTNKMMIIDGLRMKCRTIEFHKAKECKVCGEHAVITDIEKCADAYTIKGCSII